MAFSTVLVLTIVILCVGGCGGQESRLDVSGKAADLRFVLTGEGGARPCIDRFTISPAAEPDAAPAWRVIAVDPAKCVTDVRYGEPGMDFGQEAGPVPLRPGVTYRARASGAGFTVVRDFSVTADGVR